MKWLEYIGVALAAAGFGLLSTGLLKIGFIVGCASCLFLMPYFKMTKQYGLFTLHIYFSCANMLGIYTNWS